MENYVFLRMTANGQTYHQSYTNIVKGKKQTPIIWNQTIDINVPRDIWSTAVLEVFIKDKDLTSDDVCGYGKINLEHCGFFLQPGVMIPYSIRLYGEKNSEVSGELNFTSILR